MSSADHVLRFQDENRYDETTESPQEYHRASIFHTSRGKLSYSRLLRTTIAPLAPLNPDDSDLAMSEAPPLNSGPQRPRITLPRIDDSGDIVMADASECDILSGPPATSGVHFTPPQGYRPPGPTPAPHHRFGSLRSAIKKRTLMPEEHLVRLQWENILETKQAPHEDSPSDYFRAVVEANTASNQPVPDAQGRSLLDRLGRNIYPKRTHIFERLPAPAELSTPKPSHISTAAPTAHRDSPEPFPRKILPAFSPARAVRRTSPPRLQKLVSPPQQQEQAQPQQPQQQQPSPPTSNSPSPTSESPVRGLKRSRDEISEDNSAPLREATKAAVTDLELSHEEMPLRRIAGMMAEIHAQFWTSVKSLWRMITGQAQYLEERVAVEADNNRHKRRAVSPEAPLVARPPGAFIKDEKPVQVEQQEGEPQEAQPQEVNQQQVEEQKSAPAEPAHVPARVAFKKIVHEAKLAGTARDDMVIVRDGMTAKQFREKLTEEAKRRGTAISPNDPSRLRRYGQPGRPGRFSKHVKTSGQREDRVQHLVERSHNIITKQRSPIRLPKRAVNPAGKIRHAQIVKEFLERQEKQRRMQEDNTWEAQVKAEEEKDARIKEELAKKAAEEEAARLAAANPIIHKLEPHWLAQIDKAVNSNPSKQVATALDGSELYGRDFERIVPPAGAVGTSAWLNDNAVNGWFLAIVERKNEQTGYKKSSPNAPSFAAMNTAWITKVQKDGVKSIARWTKRMGVQGPKLLTADKIFFPVNSGNHWTLMVLSPKTREIEYLDSMGGSGSTYRKYAREWLAMELGAGYIADEWKDVTGRSSQQQNMDDCGVFTCFNGLAAAKERDFAQVTHRQMPQARRMLAAVLLNRGFTGDFDL